VSPLDSAEIVRAAELAGAEALLRYAELGLYVFPLPPGRARPVGSTPTARWSTPAAA
jgi:hypothetical protein